MGVPGLSAPEKMNSALLKITVPAADQAVPSENFHFRFDRARLRVLRRREGRYLLRSNLTDRAPGELWTCYLHFARRNARAGGLSAPLEAAREVRQEPCRRERKIWPQMTRPVEISAERQPAATLGTPDHFQKREFSARH